MTGYDWQIGDLVKWDFVPWRQVHGDHIWRIHDQYQSDGKCFYVIQQVDSPGNIIRGFLAHRFKPHNVLLYHVKRAIEKGETLENRNQQTDPD